MSAANSYRTIREAPLRNISNKCSRYDLTRKSEPARRHSISRLSDAGEFVQPAKLLVSQGISIFGERRVLLNLVVWIAQPETLDPVLLLA